MAESQHTIVYIFDPNNPRISAFEIHEWIHDQLHVSKHSLTMIQIDGTRRHFFSKVCRRYLRSRLITCNERSYGVRAFDGRNFYSPPGDCRNGNATN